MFHYVTEGTCSRAIDFDIVDGIVRNVHFTKGCNGNTQGVAALVEGRSAEEVIALLDGIKCGPRPTSCPDQLAQALKQAIGRE